MIEDQRRPELGGEGQEGCAKRPGCRAKREERKAVTKTSNEKRAKLKKKKKKGIPENRWNKRGKHLHGGSVAKKLDLHGREVWLFMEDKKVKCLLSIKGCTNGWGSNGGGVRIAKRLCVPVREEGSFP